MCPISVDSAYNFGRSDDDMIRKKSWTNFNLQVGWNPSWFDYLLWVIWYKTRFLASCWVRPSLLNSPFLGWLANNSSHVSQVPMVAFQIARAHFQLYLLLFVKLVSNAMSGKMAGLQEYFTKRQEERLNTVFLRSCAYQFG